MTCPLSELPRELLTAVLVSCDRFSRLTMRLVNREHHKLFHESFPFLAASQPIEKRTVLRALRDYAARLTLVRAPGPAQGTPWFAAVVPGSWCYRILMSQRELAVVRFLPRVDEPHAIDLCCQILQWMACWLDTFGDPTFLFRLCINSEKVTARVPLEVFETHFVVSRRFALRTQFWKKAILLAKAGRRFDVAHYIEDQLFLCKKQKT